MSDLDLLGEIAQNCVTSLNGSYVKCEERGKKIIFCNTDHLMFHKIKVDGCAVDSDDEKCDCLILVNSQRRNDYDQHFIELKGNKIDKAIRQLKSCFEKFSKYNFNRRFAYVVSSYVPKSSTKIQQYKMNFWKKFRAELYIKNREIHINVASVQHEIKYSLSNC